MTEVLTLIREADLQATVEGLLALSGCKWFHDVDARRDRRGFPDLIWPRGDTLHCWELKTERGVLRKEQMEWAAELLACRRIDYRVLRPRDLDWARAYILGDPGREG